MAPANKLNGLNLIRFDFFKAQDPENGRFDVIFEINGKKLYAHKTMLNLVSDTFNAMVSDRWNSKNDEPIQIKDYSFEDFYQFITFLYSGQCELSDENICAMTDMAEYYNVPLFKSFCDDYLSKITLTAENVFQFLDLSNKYSMIQLKNAVNNFITLNFSSLVNCETFLKFNKSVVQELVVAQKDTVNPEHLFQVVYKWAEKQVEEKQDQSGNINKNDAIKFEISEFLPHIDFGKMRLCFLLQYVVPRCFIFASLDEFSNILCQSYSTTKNVVKVTNSDGETLYGNLIPDNTVIENFKVLSLRDEYRYGYGVYCQWETNCQIPSTPSPLKKREDIEWYLIYNNCGRICIVHRSELSAEYYLLAEMMPENGKEFRDAYRCKIKML